MKLQHSKVEMPGSKQVVQGGWQAVACRQASWQVAGVGGVAVVVVITTHHHVTVTHTRTTDHPTTKKLPRRAVTVW